MTEADGAPPQHSSLEPPGTDTGRLTAVHVDEISMLVALSFLLVGVPITLLAYFNVYLHTWSSQVVGVVLATLPVAIGYTYFAGRGLVRPVYTAELWFVIGMSQMMLSGILHLALATLWGLP